MSKPLLFFGLIVIATVAFAQAGRKPITRSAIWQPDSDFLKKAHTACDEVSPPQTFDDCVIKQMAQVGASADAASFTRELFKQNGELGIVSGFDQVGPVDIAWVSYPLRSTYGLLLVNGKPRIINVEKLKQLDQKSMQQSPQFQDLQNQFPKVNLWPGDRDGKTWPNTQPGPDGGVQFIIGYPLRNGCQTCTNAGFALFTWNFDKSGKFTGTSFLGMTPAPLTQPGSGNQQ